ncbi:MAG TPA: hypothetical protein VJV77_07605 [Casimicrobiaceae bacterium]|nr:hypothetical protein [Casimicrobiaceae bacterium]
MPASSEDVPLGSLATTDSTVVASISLTTDAQVVASVPPMATDSKVDADVPLVAGITRSSVRRGDAPVERVPGGGLLRADSLPVILESLLDQGILVPQAEKTYGALPGMFGTPPVLIAGPASQSRAREESQEFTWRETGFNVMRWTSAALAVLAVVGIVLVLVMPEVRRRLFFPDMPQMPPRPA